MSAVLAWGRERMPVVRFGLLSLYLGLAAFGSGNILQVAELETLSIQVVAAWCLVASFRILDDIADRPLDAIRQPDRVLVTVSSLRPFWMTAVGLFALGLVFLLMLGGWFGVALVMALALCFAGLYRVGAGCREYWVLLKYPVFVVALGAGQWTTPLLVFLSLAIYEHIEDSDLRESPGTFPILVFFFICAGFATALAVDGTWWFWAVAWASATALSSIAYAGGWAALAPVYLIFSVLVFQGGHHV